MNNSDRLLLPPGERLTRATCARIALQLLRNDRSTVETESTENDEKIYYKLVEPLLSDSETPIRITVRSVPIAIYRNVLRHYYVRIENLLDIHPGTNHRLSLAWFHNSTVLPQDRQERTILMCKCCCDKFLDNLWNNSESFNIVWNNCDAMLNERAQSLALITFTVTSAWMFCCDEPVGLLIICIAFVVLLVTMYCSSIVCDTHDYETHLEYRCQHLLTNEFS